MKKIIRDIFIALLALSIFPLGLLAYEKQLPKFYGETYYAELQEMHQRLQSCEEKKIVIIGGSNVAFGIDVAQFEQEVPGYQVCPMGLYAAIGISPMLELALDDISEGDIVILAIEPTSESYSTYFGANAYWKCAESCAEMLYPLSWSEKGAMVGAYYKYLQERLALAKSGEELTTGDVYAKSSFDENCSMSFLREGNTMALGYDTATPIIFGEITIEDKFALEINAFAEKAREAGAEVYLSFCPMNVAGIQGEPEDLDSFYQQLDEKVDCTIISNPESYILDSCWFYDNNVHLNTYGAMVRTHLLASDLLAQLGIYKEADFTEPERPRSIYQPKEEEKADADDTDDFFYEAIEGGYRIVGLTEQGRKEANLRIPSTYEGKVVVTFDAMVFARNTAIEEITIPDTIESIPDGSFAKASHLTRIVMLPRDDTPSIGEGLLDDNTQVKIYVPEENYGLYRDGTGCTENLWANYLDRIERY